MIRTENKEIVINSDDLLECLYNDILPKNVVCDSDLHHELSDKYTQLMNVYGLKVNSQSNINKFWVNNHWCYRCDCKFIF